MGLTWGRERSKVDAGKMTHKLKKEFEYINERGETVEEVYRCERCGYKIRWFINNRRNLSDLWFGNPARDQGIREGVEEKINKRGEGDCERMIMEKALE